MSVERRSAVAMVAGGDTSTAATIAVSGVAVPYLSDSAPLPFIEQFAPDAFRDQVAEGFAGVTGQFQHDQVFVLASVDSSTLQVRDDALGLRYSMRIPGSLAYVRELVESGVTAGASIGFSAIEDEWSVDPVSGYPRRLVTRAILAEISIVASPAYRAATAYVSAGPLRARPARGGERREGKVLSAKNLATIQSIHDSLMASLESLRRDLLDVPLKESPDTGGGGKKPHTPTTASPPAVVPPHESKNADFGRRKDVGSLSFREAARQIRAREKVVGLEAAARRRQRMREIELQSRVYEAVDG